MFQKSLTFDKYIFFIAGLWYSPRHVRDGGTTLHRHDRSRRNRYPSYQSVSTKSCHTGYHTWILYFLENKLMCLFSKLLECTLIFHVQSSVTPIGTYFLCGPNFAYALIVQEIQFAEKLIY